MAFFLNFLFFWWLFTWSIKCLSCTSSSLKSLLWRWAFNLVKNSFCRLMSVAKIKEPSCCSISCLHPQEWERKHTHKTNPSELGDRFCHRQVACNVIAAFDTIYNPEHRSDSLTSHHFCPWQRYATNCTEWLKSQVNKVVVVYTFPGFLWMEKLKAN